MGGRPGKPIEFLVIDGKKHLTKKEIEHRKKKQIRLGAQVFVSPEYIKKDKVAINKWGEVVEIFSDPSASGLITSADTGMIARYCLAHSEYLDLVKHRANIETIEFSITETSKVQEALDDYLGQKEAQRMWQKMEYLMSISGLFAIDKAINSKMGELIKMEDRLFLNPQARVKNVPKKEEQQVQEDTVKQMFGD